MDSQYNIVINIKTPDGMVEIGNFFVGYDREFADETFSELKGDQDIKRSAILRIDLVKKNKWPPSDCLDSIGCTLDEYLENCRIIARNTFKYLTMEG